MNFSISDLIFLGQIIELDNAIAQNGFAIFRLSAA